MPAGCGSSSVRSTLEGQAKVSVLAHLGFLSLPFLGHLNPMRALGGALLARGHRITVFGQADIRPVVEPDGFGFVPLGAATHPPGDLDRTLKRIAAVRGLFGIGAVIADMARTTDMLCRELPDALSAAGIDLLVSDQLEAAGGLVAARLGLPFVSVANGLPIEREDAVPPTFTHWPPPRADWELRRNRGAYQVSDFIMRPLGRTIAQHAARFGLPPRTTQIACASPFATLTQLVPEFDMPRPSAPATLHHVGPLRPLQPNEPPLPIVPDGRPLVFASLGTLLGSRFDLFAAIADACRGADVQLLIAHCGGLTEAQVAKLPGRPAAVRFAPQLTTIAQASLVITHAGMNTVLDALTHGVPTIVVPLAFDHPGIAARLVRTGAGIRLMPRKATPAALGAAVREALTAPEYRAAAARMAAAFGKAAGARRGAEIVEAVLRTGQPVPAAAARAGIAA